MDKDTRAVIALLDEALTASGLTAAAFAVALGTSSSRFSTYRTGRTRPTGQFCMRAQRLGNALGQARARRLMSAIDTATEVRTATDEDWLWRMLLQGRDHLRLMLSRHDGSEAAWDAKPATTGSARFDTLLSALTAREYANAGEEPPAWCANTKPLDEPWIPQHPFMAEDEVIAATPSYLADLNVFVPERDLVTA
jgi:hypothetical protein